jgi:hypothetical protein
MVFVPSVRRPGFSFQRVRVSFMGYVFDISLSFLPLIRLVPWPQAFLESA